MQIYSEDCILSDFLKIETKQATKYNLDLASEIKLFQIKFSEYKMKCELFALQLKKF